MEYFIWWDTITIATMAQWLGEKRLYGGRWDFPWV
jgi:hypothetical protein